MNHIIALSGGKDSTALALRLREIEPRDYIYLCTPTGNEMPTMIAHWTMLEQLLDTPLTRITNGTLLSWITEYEALPNWRQRWCTRLLKIEPCLAYLKSHQPATLYVGLRADEEERKGIYSADVVCRFPLREWGWKLADVQSYLRERQVSIPERTDCAWCYGQRLSEWKKLWRDHRELYAEAEALEQKTGATFRSPGRDSWPASLAGLRQRFERGHKVKGEDEQLEFGWAPQACRVCQL